MSNHKNPALAVDGVIFHKSYDNIILIERKNPPLGWALPGGFVDVGESLRDAFVREMREELSIDVFVLEQFFTYSNPLRDPRKHVVSTVFLAVTTEKPKADDDAKSVLIIPTLEAQRLNLCFDHWKIVDDAIRYVISDGRRRRL